MGESDGVFVRRDTLLLRTFTLVGEDGSVIVSIAP